MSDYETIQRRRNIIVGIFVIVAVCVLVWLIFKFGDLPTTVSKISSFDVLVQFPTAPGVQKRYARAVLRLPNRQGNRCQAA